MRISQLNCDSGQPNPISRRPKATLGNSSSSDNLKNVYTNTKKSTTFTAITLPKRNKDKGALGSHCDFIGSSTNLIMVTSTTILMFTGRFELMPSANKKVTTGLKLETRDSSLQTRDPTGFPLADTLACGTVGHIIGVSVGVVLGFKNIGAI